MLQLESQSEEKANNHKIIQTKAQLNNSVPYSFFFVPYSYQPSLEHYFGRICDLKDRDKNI